MKTFNIQTIRSWNPCYEPNRHLPENWRGTVLDILDNKAIPFEDRLWVICRNDLVSDKLMRLFAVWCARQVQHLMKDERSIHALDFMDAFIEHIDLIDDEDWRSGWQEERAAAWAAARDAARAAAWAAAWDAARDAAWAAARDAAWDAAWAAARDAARDAAWDAARDAAWAAARDAARAAAWAAASDAAWDAAWAAARDAARDAAWDAQESKLRELLIAGVETGDTL
jgi:hypothetical protein